MYFHMHQLFSETIIQTNVKRLIERFV